MDGHDLNPEFDEFLPLRDVVFKTLRQSILSGDLNPGERLMEIHLAKKLGVSRTPIREAIRMLELEGLVTMVPRKGAEVSRISADDMRDVLEVRRSLDSLAVSLACERMTAAEREKLKEAELEFEDAIKTKKASVIAGADVKFHDIILISSKNKRLLQLVNNLAERVYRYRLEYVKDERNHEKLISEHRQIMENIFSGNKAEAKKAIEIHIDNQEKNIIKQLSDENKNEQ
ncbi:MAG: GntR family transcriptional regulator [Lachnospiraceae bacterium]|nr:GntR family transcriptional regulator [Lachnospiraceae bacterium]